MSTSPAAHDFIRPGEEAIYNQLTDSVFDDLQPVGILEITLADEIRRAMWRLRRCALVEESFSTVGAYDPMQLESHSRVQASVDHARSQAHRLLHKCTAELRKLQTERIYRDESLAEGADLSNLGIADWPSIQTRLINNESAASRSQRAEEKAELDAFDNALLRDCQSGPFCKNIEPPAPGIPRAA